mgnify:CR=1 FL=1
MRVVATFFCVLVGAIACTAPPAAPKAATDASATAATVSGVVPANAIVTLLPADGAPPMPAEPAVIDQISKQFLPSSIIVRPGQALEFRNSDDLPHNITVTRRVSGSEVFNVSTERAQKYVHTFDRLGQYDVRCDIHEGMEATVIVAPLLPDDAAVEIDESDLKIDTFRAERDTLEQDLVVLRAELSTAENSIETERVDQVTDSKAAEELQTKIQTLAAELADRNDLVRAVFLGTEGG